MTPLPCPAPAKERIEERIEERIAAIEEGYPNWWRDPQALAKAAALGGCGRNGPGAFANYEIEEIASRKSPG